MPLPKTILMVFRPIPRQNTNNITEIKQANGDIKTVQINAHLVKESDNKPLIIEGTIVDITEKYILEKKLKK